MPTPATMPLLLVDGHHLLYRAHFGFPKRFEALDGTDATGAFGFVALLRKHHLELCAGHEVIVVFDAEDGAAARARADAGYKANRPGADHSPIQALAPLKRMLDLAQVPWVEAPGAEGDDVLASLAGRAVADGRPVVVLSGDRDLYGLLTGPGVRILSPQAPPERQFVTADTVVERYGVTPGQWADFRALTGDPADNLPGVPGIGPVTAARLLAGGRELEDLPLTAPGRLAKPLARTRACWDDVMRWRSLHLLNTGLTCHAPLTGTATGELPAPANLMKAASLW
ncbi:hypothetical protein OTB20_39190 [Streptomyces sp. H27-H1]|uniref:5'-3' exonuclease n=1 Tax=Streptomyces sp. H27-H1 TaxID=2996461 RepID=UPI0022704AFB|nr:5'-3' exonuclease H3TH domain-containing protein [Streptomyces sp. H27-H1]MCY0932096.1 hypothetical protein [Streptomyces sp. H27-H1]